MNLIIVIVVIGILLALAVYRVVKQKAISKKVDELYEQFKLEPCNCTDKHLKTLKKNVESIIFEIKCQLLDYQTYETNYYKLMYDDEYCTNKRILKTQLQLEKYIEILDEINQELLLRHNLKLKL